MITAWLLVLFMGMLILILSGAPSWLYSYSDEHPTNTKLQRIEAIQSGRTAPGGWRKGEWEMYKCEHPNRTD